MTERSRFLPLVVAATAALLFAAAGATIAVEQAHALKCKPACIPPPEEELPGEELPPPPPPPAPTPAPAKHRVLVVNVGWGTGASSSDSPLREGLLPQYVGYINGFVNDWFTQSAPPGAFPGWAAEAGGSYTISQPNLPSSCTEDEQDAFMSSVINRTHLKLEQVGVNYERYGLVAIVYDRTYCFFGVQPGNRVLLSDLGSTIHELGHFLGLRKHANLLRCKDAGGNTVPLSTTCEEVEYGDPFDQLGNGEEGRLSFNAAFAKHLGWLNGQFLDVRAPATGTWTIKPFIGAGFSDRAIRLQDGPTTLWIEYRRPIGIDALEGSPLLQFPLSTGSGVFIRREVWGGNAPVSQLLDLTPGLQTSFSLEGGQTWANPLGEATITLDQFGPEGATITVGSRRTATVPNVIGLDPARAAAIIANAGLWSRSFSPVIDQTCSNIGVVSEQEPFPGLKAIPGTEVRLGVGEHPPFPCP